MADQESSNFPSVPTKVKDLTGQQFGRLTAIAFGGIYRMSATWYCRCDCGRYRAARSDHLIQGRTTSCGCFQREGASVRNRTHGFCRRGAFRAEYNIWYDMMFRCRSNDLYTGRGITVCERWLSVEHFIADMGRRPTSKHTIERIDNEQGYFPENCKWATRKEQQRNTRRNHLITHQGKTQCIVAWAEELGINQSTIRSRFRLGWSTERALTFTVEGRSNGSKR